jgi:hypothetical protein
MKFRFGTGLGLLAVSSVLFGASGCSGDAEDAPALGAGGETSAASGASECKVLGELCHASDTGSGDAHECHEMAHRGDGAACLESFASCVDTCVPSEVAGVEKDPRCAALGELCHPVDDDDGPLHECHELGHVNDPEICAASFDGCATRCLAALAELEAEAEHGSGGAPGGH